MLLVLVFPGTSAIADLSYFKPEELCALLYDFGVETSPNQEPEESPALCYTTTESGDYACDDTH